MSGIQDYFPWYVLMNISTILKRYSSFLFIIFSTIFKTSVHSEGVQFLNHHFVSINQHVIMIICMIGIFRAYGKSNVNQIRIFWGISFCCAPRACTMTGILNFCPKIYGHLCFLKQQKSWWYAWKLIFTIFPTIYD